MAVFCPVVQPLVRPVLKAGDDLAFRRAIGPKLVRHDPLGQAMAPDQRLQKPFRGALVPLRLQDFVQNDPVLINRPPEPETLRYEIKSDVPRALMSDTEEVPEQKSATKWPKIC
ncbi:hypothetical protein ATO3_24370 [Marinibacterium profundimaris]|uniref:Uncharacterized protein n=1 Tax=Marinibacterium profundimaris TaxID=1679460 RepID=A0A225NIM2_9RHOB|nr:hypothetical protein ATO3_24370 [Marinibacterium profundimaris]